MPQKNFTSWEYPIPEFRADATALMFVTDVLFCRVSLVFVIAMYIAHLVHFTRNSE